MTVQFSRCKTLPTIGRTFSRRLNYTLLYDRKREETHAASQPHWTTSMYATFIYTYYHYIMYSYIHIFKNRFLSYRVLSIYNRLCLSIKFFFLTISSVDLVCLPFLATAEFPSAQVFDDKQIGGKRPRTARLVCTVLRLYKETARKRVFEYATNVSAVFCRLLRRRALVRWCNRSDLASRLRHTISCSRRRWRRWRRRRLRRSANRWRLQRPWKCRRPATTTRVTSNRGGSTWTITGTGAPNRNVTSSATSASGTTTAGATTTWTTTAVAADSRSPTDGRASERSTRPSRNRGPPTGPPRTSTTVTRNTRRGRNSTRPPGTNTARSRRIPRTCPGSRSRWCSTLEAAVASGFSYVQWTDGVSGPTNPTQISARLQRGFRCIRKFLARVLPDRTPETVL